MSNVKIGCCTLPFNGKSLDEALDTIKEAEIKGVEIWGGPKHTPKPASEEDIMSIAGKVKSRNLEIFCYGSYLNGFEEEEFNGYKLNITDELKTAELLGAKKIRLWAGNKPSRDFLKVEFDRVVRNFQEYADIARDMDITIVIERHGSTLTDDFNAPEIFLSAVNKKNCLLNWQIVPHNFLLGLTEEESVEKFEDDLKRYVPKSGHAHIHNIKKQGKGFYACFLDEGIIDYCKLADVFMNSEFSGNVMIESIVPEEGMTEIEGLKRDVNYLKMIFNKKRGVNINGKKSNQVY